MPRRNLGIPHKTPNDLLTADEFNAVVAIAEDAVVTVAELGLDNVNNTSDVNKPISAATQAALNNKQNNLGYTPENPNNKVVDLATPNHTTYPTTLAVSNAIFTAISDGDVVVTDANSTTKGKIKLAGDLGGTADVPTVPGLSLKENTLPTGTTAQYLRGDKTMATLSSDVVTEGATNKYLTLTERNKLNGISAGATVNDTDVNLKNRANHTGTQSADTVIDGTTNKAYTAAEKTKLAGVATGATVNSPDATLLARASHTGTQSADTLTDGTTNKAFLATERTKLSGISTGATVNDTDANLKNRANHTGTQTADTIIDGTTNKVFTAANQTKLSGIATAATANSTDAALRDRSTHTGAQAATTITEDSTHRFATDSEKTTWNAKQDALVSNTNIKTVDGISVLGSGDIPFPTTDLTTKVDLTVFEEYDSGGGVMKLRLRPAYVQEQIYKTFIQRRYGVWIARHTDAAISTEFISAPTSSGGTIASVAYNIATYYGRLAKVSMPSAVATANTAMNIRSTKVQYSMQQGFKTSFIYAVNDAATVADGKLFVGLTTATGGLSSTSTTNPSAMTEGMIGIGNDGGDTNLSIISGPSGSLVKTGLGSNFPAQTTDIIILTLEAAPGATSVAYTVTRKSRTDGSIVGSVASGTVTSIPASTTTLGQQLWRGNGTTALAVEFVFMLHTIEQGGDTI